MPKYRVITITGEHLETIDAPDSTHALATVALDEGYTVELEDSLPRRSPDPCYQGCPGWGIFEVNRCTVHGDDCNGWWDDCDSLEIQACDECWRGVPDAPDDAYYQSHPYCQAKLKSEE